MVVIAPGGAIVELHARLGAGVTVGFSLIARAGALAGLLLALS